jgi:hypothetical protein
MSKRMNRGRWRRERLRKALRQQVGRWPSKLLPCHDFQFSGSRRASWKSESCYITFRAVECSKLGLGRASARFGLSGATPGEREELRFRRVSSAARLAQICSHRVRLVGIFHRRLPCRTRLCLERWPNLFSPASRPLNTSRLVAAERSADHGDGFGRWRSDIWTSLDAGYVPGRGTWSSF